MSIKIQMPRKLMALPSAPAEALSLAHDETLYLKKINSIFFPLMKRCIHFLTVP